MRVRDREVHEFLFRADNPKPVGLAEAMGGLIGSVNTGLEKKSLEGFGRD